MPLSASIQTRLRHQHQTIRELIDPLTELQLKQRINPGKWSAFENIAHLACYQPVFLHRLERIQSENNAIFGRYVAEEDPDFPGYGQQQLSRLLGDIDANRKMIITLFDGLNEPTLQRTGTHARYGLLAIPKWTEFFLLHEAHHLYTIFMLVQDLRRNLPE
jgi:hypothetical protein